MKQREVTNSGNVRWTCVQAYSGLENQPTEKTEELAANVEGKVAVVCTPSGGAQSVRLELAKNWLEEMNDEELIDMISKSQ